MTYIKIKKLRRKISLKLESFEIEEIMPHRYPFLLVDRIIDGEWGEFAVGIKQVTRNEWFFDGHFPGKPIMPGVYNLKQWHKLAE